MQSLKSQEVPIKSLARGHGFLKSFAARNAFASPRNYFYGTVQMTAHPAVRSTGATFEILM